MLNITMNPNISARSTLQNSQIIYCYMNKNQLMKEKKKRDIKIMRDYSKSM